MAGLRLEHIYKVYSNGTKAVNDFTMEIKDGEFIVFVGPSGCGKSTTLRMIAGLEEITAGELYIDNNIVNNVEPKDRDIAMVFQNYALYPHMTIYENMAFGLKLRHVPNDVIHEKVLWAADVLGIKEYLDRKPKAMSGGQRQRVALGRAILRDPKVMLLDEPLSNLDAKLRTQMRSEIAKLHQKLQTTFIYVTHDQTEAMTLGTRVVVMKLGHVQQIDTPKNLYNYPANKFVAGFIGTPQMNFFQGTLLRKKDSVEVKFAWSEAKIEVPYNDLLKVKHTYLDGNHQVYIGLRCEHISLAKPEDKENVVDVVVSHFEELGSETLLYGDINMQGDGFAETSTRVIMKIDDIGDIKIGDVVKVKFNMKKAHFFDRDTEESILPRVPSNNVFDCKVKDNTVEFNGYSVKLPGALHVENDDNASLIIPNDALILGEGNLEAVVRKIEVIEGKKLAYLEHNARTFFTLCDDKVKEGKTVKFNIDYTKIDVLKTIDGKEVSIANPIVLTDTFQADFYNYQTVINNNSDPKYVAEYNERANACKAKYDELFKKLDADLNAEKEKYATAEIKEKLAIASKELEALTKENSSKTNEAKAKYKQGVAVLKTKHKNDVAHIKAENKATFAARVKEEKASYAKFLKENKDKLTVRRRKEEHRVFKESTPGEKELELNNALTNEGLIYETEKSQLHSEMKRTVEILKNQVKEKKAEIQFLSNPNAKLEKDFAKKKKELSKAYASDMRKAKLMFFFNLNGYYLEVGDLISGKLVQGLGTKVFNSSFLLDIPHDAYQLVNEGGIEVKVVENLDYDVTKYAKCELKVNGEIKNIYITTKDAIEVGTVLHVIPDVSKSQITETSMNIRLY